MGSADAMMEALDKLSAKIDDMKVTLDKLAPLAPVADQLATIPTKVVTLQSSAFENAEQVRALNLALIRVENSQREGKALATDDGDTTGFSANKSKTGKPPLFPEIPREPPKNHFSVSPPESGQGQYADEDDFTDNRFHPHIRLEFPSFDGKEDPLPWLNRCETFVHGQGTPERCRVWYAAMHLTGAAQLWYARLELTSGTPLRPVGSATLRATHDEQPRRGTHAPPPHRLRGGLH
jgi:hypothetical protein